MKITALFSTQSLLPELPKQVAATIDKSSNPRDIRHNLKLRLTRLISGVERLSFKYRSAVTWINLPQSSKNVEERTKFKFDFPQELLKTYQRLAQF